MEPHEAYHLEQGSDRFRLLCTRLNLMVRRDDASWSVDLLSGGFKYNDEIPDGLSESPELFLPLTTLLRSLWAYRSSLVEGRPRPDLHPTWESTRRLAPRWAGFAPDRCSAEMRLLVAEVRSRDEQFARDVERLEPSFTKGRDTGMHGVDDGDMVKMDQSPIGTDQR